MGRVGEVLWGLVKNTAQGGEQRPPGLMARGAGKQECVGWVSSLGWAHHLRGCQQVWGKSKASSLTRFSFASRTACSSLCLLPPSLPCPRLLSWLFHPSRPLNAKKSLRLSPWASFLYLHPFLRGFHPGSWL